MAYNFDELIERRGTGSYKWDEAPSADVIPLWVADMDFRVAPAIQEALRQRVAHGVFGYTMVDNDYYEAVQSWFLRRHGWTIRREDMLYTSGVVPAMSCVLKALTMPGERVLTLTPAYNCFFSSIRNNGCEVQNCELGIPAAQTAYAVDWDDFERKCADEKTTVFLLCNPHNPTGRVWTREELGRMADICHRHGVAIVSDEIHCELIMPGYKFVPMATVAADAIILNSPSKSFNMAGLQIANIICTDPQLRRRIDRAININEVCDVNPFGPIALKAAYNESEDWIDELCLYLKGNYDTLRQTFAGELPQLPVAELEGTYLVWVDIRPLGISADTLADRLLSDHKVWVNSSVMYGTEGFIRINIACPRSRLTEGLRRLVKGIQEIAATRAV